jgi:hypothetical protein
MEFIFAPHSKNMNEAKQSKKKDAKAEPKEVEVLGLLIERVDGVYKELGEIIMTLDRLYLEKKSAGSPPAWDFLVKDKRPANKGK